MRTDSSSPLAPAASAGTPAAETFLSAADILNAEDTVFGVIDAPEWGGKLRLRSLTGDERAQLEARISRRAKATPGAAKSAKGGADASGDASGGAPPGAAENIGLREYAVWLAAVDGKGARIFTDQNQIRGLRQKNAAPISRAWDKVLELSGMTPAERQRIGEELDEDPT